MKISLFLFSWTVNPISFPLKVYRKRDQGPFASVGVGRGFWGDNVV